MAKKNIEENIEENIAPQQEAPQQEAPQQEAPQQEASHPPVTEYEAICRVSIIHNNTDYNVGDLIYLTNKSDYDRLLKLNAIE